MMKFMPEPHLLESPRGREWPHPLVSRSAATGPLPVRADVVIVGAGPAGLAVASALWHLGVSDVVLLDRDGRPCQRFFDRIDTLGQRVLRSPYEHHPGVEGYRDCELLDFARLHWSRLTPVERREIRMAQAGHRSVVPVDVFEAYSRHIAAVHGVTARTWCADVHEVRPGRTGLAVHTDHGRVNARFTVLCLGEERRAAPAAWSGGVGYWDEPVPASARSVVVVGAGLSAAHVIANSLARGLTVRWVLRENEERYQCADVNASFFRPEGRARFDHSSWSDRLTLMGRHRRASVMFEFQPLLRAAEADGRLTVHRGHAVVDARPGAVRLADGNTVHGDHVVLAIGTTPSTGEGLLPADIVRARDGWPDLDERTLAYRADPRVLAVGAAACMVLGPAARNIDGHRVATARVAATIAARIGVTVPTAMEVAALV
ncbi:Predicted flavoprotein CzcO associated with the cation diffusion facilitator CzcD [Actinokineospora alba]|uniref:Predicted flavoprotein CzcO associated with the cation diffusion facilitator CzcD n=1 Tax=Actinokineospora alba TaxID=504798 RepID=A0A1H0UVQ3_9PSEU|nr:FAD-dependent monooxygenase [Actinokineospora alba]TDP69024.1 cation diffusion facilitator CzcD-associated flavoprotein CzcO [Actinokineospora alba]SDI77811.1 Predicted flavoprotein CzcO associated with the cation diffusion facilitator CzcD [Actinokineospora alba]SDP70304.1 Predicted flavoprotein CzcO associated with the cation diffusion facilitator CzcD [Actinokineospora alba]